MRLFDPGPSDKHRPALFDRTPTGRNVLDEARARFGWLWDNYETVIVSMSTGKDSLVAADIAAQTAPAGRRPVVLYEDDELMPTGSQAVAEHWAQRDDIDMVWSTTPTTYRCHWIPAGTWTTWDPARTWHRPKPKQSVVWADCPPHESDTQHRRRFFSTLPKPMVQVLGCRAAESAFRRMRINLSQRQGNRPPWVFKRGHCWPLYDWLAGDVWKYIADHQLPYNVIYDRFTQAGLAGRDQRIGMIINHPGTKAAQLLPVVDPELYAAALALWPGFAGLIRYPEDPRITGYRKIPPPPEGMTWLRRIRRIVAANPDGDAREYITRETIRLIRHHRRKAPGEPILAHTPNPHSGISWEVLTRIALRGEPHIGEGQIAHTAQHIHTSKADIARWERAKMVQPRR